MEIECHNCKWKWNYQGDRSHYASCPNCHYQVSLIRYLEKQLKEIEAEQESSAEKGVGVMVDNNRSE